MERREYFELTAPCGLDCFNCELLEANLTAERRGELAAAAKRAPAEVGCPGCRAGGGCPSVPEPCPTRGCAAEHGVAFCSQCDNFPCPRLMPVREAAAWPHNLKLYNLCRIQAVGLRRWAEEEAGATRARYAAPAAPLPLPPRP